MDRLLSPSSLLFFASVTDSKNMKPFTISERTRPKEITSQKRRSLITTGKGMTRSTLTASACVDCIIFGNCTLFYVLALEKKNGSGEKKICLKYEICTTAFV